MLRLYIQSYIIHTHLILYILCIQTADLTSYVRQQNSTSRYQDFIAGRTPQIYDNIWHKQHVIHFTSVAAYDLRLLIPYYTFFYFEDIRQDRRMKRFIRDW